VDFLLLNFLLGVTAEAPRAKIDWKSAYCKGWPVSAKFSALSGLPINVTWTFFARCYGWTATSEYRL